MKWAQINGGRKARPFHTELDCQDSAAQSAADRSTPHSFVVSDMMNRKDHNVDVDGLLVVVFADKLDFRYRRTLAETFRAPSHGAPQPQGKSKSRLYLKDGEYLTYLCKDSIDELQHVFATANG